MRLALQVLAEMLQRRCYPSSRCFLLLPLLLLSSASMPINPYYANCSDRVYCGKLTVQYPFRLLQSPTYCGYPGYELNCILNDESPQLTIKLGEEDYAIQSIYYKDRVVVVVDSSYLINDGCPRSFTNTSINSALFNYSRHDGNLTVYVNCSFSNNPAAAGLLEIPPCPNNDPFSQKRSYYRVDSGPSTFLKTLQGSCDLTAAVPVYNKQGQEFMDALKGGFGLTWNDNMAWCRKCNNSGGICGYSETRTGDPICYCPDSPRLSSCFYSTNNRNKGLIIGVTSACAALLFLLLVCVALYFHIIQSNRLKNFIFWKKNNKAQTIEAFLDTYEYLGPKRYKYSALNKMTKSFSEKLGKGGYGAVFKGEFPDGRLVAVKVLSDAKGNGDEFVNEVASIGRTSHVNVVSLLGFCSEGSKRALIYEFMSNGSLDKYIYSENLKATLGWNNLYQIAVSIARGLEYLHRGCNTRIVHFDIKPHNILLDQDFRPKISDFGLAQLCLRKDSIFSAIGARGTIGYIAPEVFSRNFGVVSSKSDVYSYGMVILEMVGARSTSCSSNESDSGYYFPHWIYEHYHQIGYMEALDVTLETVEIAKKMVLVGLWCIQTKPGCRPSMSKVVDMLQSGIDDLEMPPKPYLSSP